MGDAVPCHYQQGTYVAGNLHVTTLEFFQSTVLDMNVLSLSILNHSDPDYTPSGYWKATHRQWVFWNHRYMGRANRRVIPSCVV